MNRVFGIGLAKGPIRLGRARRLTVYLVCAGLWLTGVAWLVFHYYLRAPSDFGPQTHPLEPWWLRLHGAFAFGALWMLGLLSAAHIVNGWSSARRRWSGAIMLGAAALMTLSGYLLYYLGDEALRGATAYVHWGIGLAAPALFLLHRFAAVVFSKRDPALTRYLDRKFVPGLFRQNRSGKASVPKGDYAFRPNFRPQRLQLNTGRQEGSDE